MSTWIGFLIDWQHFYWVPLAAFTVLTLPAVRGARLSLAVQRLVATLVGAMAGLIMFGGLREALRPLLRQLGVPAAKAAGVLLPLLVLVIALGYAAGLRRYSYAWFVTLLVFAICQLFGMQQPVVGTSEELWLMMSHRLAMNVVGLAFALAASLVVTRKQTAGKQTAGERVAINQGADGVFGGSRFDPTDVASELFV